MISVISPLFLDMGLFRNQVVINIGGERGEMSSRAISFLKSFSLLCQRRLNFDPPWTENAEVKLTHPRPYY